MSTFYTIRVQFYTICTQFIPYEYMFIPYEYMFIPYEYMFLPYTHIFRCHTYTIFQNFLKYFKFFNYFREPTAEMKKKSKLIDDNCIVLDTNIQGLYHFNKFDKQTQQWCLSKYYIQVSANNIYEGLKFISCTCLSYYKSYICKHALKIADMFDFQIPGYDKTRLFAANKSKGRKRKARLPVPSNPLSYD